MMGGGGTAAAEREVQRVAGYVRVSTDMQAESGLGLADQRRRISGMCAVKGWPEARVYADEGISGTKEATDRPALARLLRDVAAGRVDAVVVLSLDRLGRKTRLVLDLVETLTARGVALISCKEQLDTSTPQGQFVLTMFAALAQLERDLISQRTKAALAELKAATGDAGGRLPYGYRRVAMGAAADDRGQQPRTQIAVAEEEAEIVGVIFRARASGCSLRAIARSLNSQGVSAPRGREWRASSIAAIVANKAMYEGARRGQSAMTWPRIT